MNKVVVVDKDDNPIGLKSYKELRYEDIYRVSALWLTDLDEKYTIVTQRKHTKHNDPGKWMMAVSGTVEEGENYEKNMAIEIEEEIGLKDVQFVKRDKIFADDGNHRFFVQYFSGKVDRHKVNIVIQEEEVEQYKWIKIDELIYWVKESPEDFVPLMKESLRSVGVMV